MQSPLSKRSKGPAQKEHDDGLAESKQGGQISQQGPRSQGPQVPQMDRSDNPYRGRTSGNTARDEHLSAGSGASMGSGGPGKAESDDAGKTGGTPERFSSDRGRNS